MIIFIAMIASITGFLFGYDEGIIAGSLQLIIGHFSMSNMTSGIVTGILPLGALFGSMVVGSLSAGHFAKKFGRKKSILFSGVLFIIGALIASSAINEYMLVIARFLLGLAIGLAAVSTPLYISETAQAKYRGALVAIYQLAITIGILSAYIVNYFFIQTHAWRLMFASGIIPAMILTLGMLFLPESPRWLMAFGNKEKAKHVLKKLRGNINIEEEINNIQLALQEEKNGNRWKELLNPLLLPVLLLGMGLFCLQQLSGINVVIYYAPLIFSEVGFKKVTAQILATIGLGFINVVMTIVSLWLIERLGRRRLMLIGFFLTAASLSTIHFSFFWKLEHLDWIAFAGLLIYIGSFAISLGPIPYVMMSEIFPLNVRGPGMSLSSVSNWGFNSLVVFTFPLMLSYIGIAWVFVVYSVICAIGFVIAYLFMPETKGIPLEDIEHYIHSGRPLRYLTPK